MGYVIAMAGKGGTGKTTIAALIIRMLKEKRLGSVLAIDADPNSNLGEILGHKPKTDIGRIIDDISARPQDIPQGMPKDTFIDYQIQTAIEEQDGFDILTMGRPEGPGCYCYVNNSLRNVMSKLINDYDYIVIDNEAGLEHLSRRTSRTVDTMLVISDESMVSLRSAKRIIELTQELKIKINKKLLLVNRCNNDIGPDKLKRIGVDYLGFLPEDKNIEQMSIDGKSVFDIRNDSAVLNTLVKLGDKIWQKD